MIRTVVVDDHSLVRKGIVTLLQNSGDIEVVGEAADGMEAIKLVETLSPSVAVFDISMPRLDGIQAIERLSKFDTQIIILSMHDDDTLVRRALIAGARGYVLKNSVTEELLIAVRSADKGDIFLSPSISQAIIDECLLEGEPESFDLTAREKEVLQLVAEGNTNKKIGELLHLSSKTIEKHRKNCMNKLGVNDLASLIREAVRHGLVIIDPLE